MHRRVEGIAGGGRHFGQAVLAGDDVQLAQGQLQAGAQRVVGGGIGQPRLHRIEQRQQVAEQALVGELARHLDLPGHPLALVLEVGAFDQRLRLELLEFGAQRLGFVDRRHVDGRLVRFLHRVVGHGSKA